MKIERAPTLITGCARSGTSIVAGCINICGSFGGNLSGPNKYNAKGMYENSFIRDHVEKPYLRSIGMDPLGQHPLPDTNSLAIPANWRRTIHSVVEREGYAGGSWYYKGAKACLIWPIWNYAFPNAKWIIVRRRSADIAQSCLNTAFMRAYKDYDGWIKWINHHEKKFVEMIEAGLNVKMIWPERIVKGNYEQLYEVIEWLGLTWKSKEVIDFIELKLWKTFEKRRLKI